MIEYIGVDVGGTNVRAGAIDKRGKLVFCNSERLIGTEKLKDLVDQITGLVQKIPSFNECKAIGIGVPAEVVDHKIVTCRNIPVLEGFPLLKTISKYFNKPVFMQNDAKLAAFGEALVGEGRNFKSVCYVGIGTGIGGGVVIDKQLYLGSNGIGGFFAEVVVDGKDISDRLISGNALLAQGRREVDKNIRSTTELFKLTLKQNKNAIALLERFKNNLVNLLINISCTINPEVVVFGGGVMRGRDMFFEDVVNRFKAKAHVLARNIKMKESLLEHNGVVGAALYAKAQGKRYDEN